MVHTKFDSTIKKVDASTILFLTAVNTIEKAAMEIKSMSVLLAKTNKELVAVKDESGLKIIELTQIKELHKDVSTQHQAVVVRLDEKNKELITATNEISTYKNDVDVKLKLIEDLRAIITNLERANAELTQINAQKQKETEALSDELRGVQQKFQFFGLSTQKNEAPKKQTYELQRTNSL